MTDWCSSTWFKTEPSTYRYPGRPVATSTASRMAQPRLPLVPGWASKIFRPMAVVSEGEGVTEAPYTRITSRRKGFCS